MHTTSAVACPCKADKPASATTDFAALLSFGASHTDPKDRGVAIYSTPHCLVYTDFVEKTIPAADGKWGHTNCGNLATT